MKRFASKQSGFSSLELVMVLALGAVVLSGVMVTYGTIMAGRTNINETVEVSLPSGWMTNFYGTGAASIRTVPVAPNYGALARAEKLRDEFHRDVLGATAVFCLYRKPSQVVNPLRYNWFPYDAAIDGQLDSSRAFYDFLVRKYPTASTVFEVPANPGASNVLPEPHATVFVTGFSSNPAVVGIVATYEIDVIRMATTRPWGFYASVRKYGFDPNNLSSQNSVFSNGWEIFYEPSIRGATSASQFAGDGFSPLFVMFDRAVKKSVVEDSVLGQDRFKEAAEHPFYFIWWPDPAMPNLESLPLSGQPREARRAYNHMGGRTSYMFTTPMFPAL